MRRSVAFLLVILCLTGAITCAASEEKQIRHDPDGILRLHMIDIGCGDAYMLTVDDLVLLIDCGTDSTEPIAKHINNMPLFEYLAASGIDHVDVHIVTHWHYDHCYNVDTLAEMYGTKDLVVYGTTRELYKDLDPLPVGTYRQMKDGDRLAVGPLDILCVGPEYLEKRTGTHNNDSLNFILTYKDIKFFFSGDYVHWSVLRRWKDELADIDVLDFPHHGLKPLYLTKDCMKKINPRVVMITGRSRGNVQEFIKDCRLRKKPVVLSVMDGNAQIITDGASLRVASHVEAGEFPDGELLPPREQ